MQAEGCRIVFLSITLIVTSTKKNQSVSSFNLLFCIYSCIIFNIFLLWPAQTEPPGKKKLNFIWSLVLRGWGFVALFLSSNEDTHRSSNESFFSVGGQLKILMSIFTWFSLSANKDKSVCLACRCTVVKGVLVQSRLCSTWWHQWCRTVNNHSLLHAVCVGKYHMIHIPGLL